MGNPADDNVASTRVSYSAAELTEDGLGAIVVDGQSAAGHWLPLLRRWYADAAEHPWLAEPNAMQVATVDAAGDPDVRTVLARGFDADGVTFYTNYQSAKAEQLAGRPRAAVVFSWLPLQRQVRLRGAVRRVSAVETADYFASRPRGSQLGAWASPQSKVIDSRAVLESALAEQDRRFAGLQVPPPSHWGGYRLTVEVAEFWQGREFRLHDRLRYRSGAAGWTVERLAP